MVTLECPKCGTESETHDNFAHRIFCRDCGTPLPYTPNTRDRVAVPNGQQAPDPRAEAMTRVNEGIRFVRAREYESSVAAFTEAIELDPSFIGALRSRADAYTKLGKHQEARADLALVESRTPKAPRSQTQPLPYDYRKYSREDTVGIGRYIISFLLAGFIGLAVQYGLRKQGWTATWINIVIFVILVILFSL